VGPWQEVGAALHLELGNDDMPRSLASDLLVIRGRSGESELLAAMLPCSATIFQDCFVL
jgi:hypothetical protein